jgi:hypothetical protein
MKRLLVLCLLIFTFGTTVNAQQVCGNGVPCGPLPWSLPLLPDLPTPTRFPTVVVTMTPSPTEFMVTEDPGGGPTPVPTGFIDLGDLEDKVATLEAILEATEEVVEDIDGGAFDENSQDLGGNAQEMFGYIRGLAGVHFGPLTAPVSFLLFSLVFTLASQILFFIVPIGAAIFGFIRKIITLIMDFLPF